VLLLIFQENKMILQYRYCWNLFWVRWQKIIQEEPFFGSWQADDIFKKPGLVFFPDDDYPVRINSKK